MTPIGHSLTGLAIGACVVPGAWSTRKKTVAFSTFVLLANTPDLPLLYWGHTRYDISHSVFSTLLACTVVALLIFRCLKRKATSPRRFVAAGYVAWFSHLLLDTTYNHGKGLAMFWPLSDTRLALTLPWFANFDLSNAFSWHNLRVALIELLSYGFLFSLAWFYRHRTLGKHSLDS